MATPADFMVDVRLRVPGVAEPLVEEAVMRVVTDFCEKTDIFQGLGRRATATAGQTFFSFLPLVGAGVWAIQKVLRVWFKTNPKPLDQVSSLSVNSPYAYAASVDGESAPRGEPKVWFEMQQPAVYPVNAAAYRVGVFPAPAVTEANAFLTLVSFKPYPGLAPIPPRSTVPDVVYKNWYWAIVYGTVADLVGTKEAKIKYNRFCVQAKGAARRGLSPGDTAVSMNPFN